MHVGENQGYRVPGRTGENRPAVSSFQRRPPPPPPPPLFGPLSLSLSLSFLRLFRDTPPLLSRLAGDGEPRAIGVTSTVRAIASLSGRGEIFSIRRSIS